MSESKIMARSLGLDVGTRRIGIAVSDTLKVIARPVEVIDRRRQSAVKRIAELLRVFDADEIIIGYPFNSDGSIGEQAQRVEQFANSLRAQVNIAVRFCDERYSTDEALDILSTRKRKQQAQPDDAIAAAVILQRYLDQSKANQDEQDVAFSPPDSHTGMDDNTSLVDTP